MNIRLKTKIIEKYGYQWQLAKAVNMPEDKLSKIIHERRKATEEEKRLIAKVLKVQPQDIF